MALWDDLKFMEQDVNQWTVASIADLTDSVTNLSDKERTEAHLVIFQVRPSWTACMKKSVNYNDCVKFKARL